MKAPSDKRIRTNIAFVSGLAFLAKFAIWTPSLLNPALTVLIAACIFGVPAVGPLLGGLFGLWRKDDDDQG